MIRISHRNEMKFLGDLMKDGEFKKTVERDIQTVEKDSGTTFNSYKGKGGALIVITDEMELCHADAVIPNSGSIKKDFFNNRYEAGEKLSNWYYFLYQSEKDFWVCTFTPTDLVDKDPELKAKMDKYLAEKI